MNQVDDRQKLAFSFNWKISLFTFLLLPLLVGLGYWQMQRAQEKQTIQEEYQRQQALPPVNLDQEQAAPDSYRRVRATGEFITEHYWLLENRIYNGRPGYHVIMPFETGEGERIVVNRGWVEASPYREELPEFATPEHAVTVFGTFIEPGDSPLIDEAENKVTGWPHRLLELDLDVMDKQVDATLFPKVLQLDADSPGALVVDWQPINMTPEKHRAYAVQWFALAIALLILFVCVSSNIGKILSKRR